MPIVSLPVIHLIPRARWVHCHIGLQQLACLHGAWPAPPLNPETKPYFPEPNIGGFGGLILLQSTAVVVWEPNLLWVQYGILLSEEIE